jgi:hypothetical protein
VDAQIPQRRARRERVADQGRRRLREQHLTPVGDGRHPGGAVDIQAHQAGGRLRCLTGVDTHPHPDLLPGGPRMGLNGLLHLRDRRYARPG